MIAECSSQVRQWATAVLANDPAVQRTQFMPGVGHHMWMGGSGAAGPSRGSGRAPGWVGEGQAVVQALPLRLKPEGLAKAPP
jgi:hypothetical protein